MLSARQDRQTRTISAGLERTLDESIATLNRSLSTQLATSISAIAHTIEERSAAALNSSEQALAQDAARTNTRLVQQVRP
jgi:hypothetical protein